MLKIGKKSLAFWFAAQISDMAGRWNSTSIVSSFPLLLLKAWNEWDVRGMVLFSLILQIALFVLGMRRKRAINLFYKTILWFAYLSADWIAIASLGKLSSSHAESPTTNVLRAFWAPLLILHLGGPDTITAYSFEDNKLWIRHLFILAVKATLVLYVVCLSWTSSWISFLNLPLILAGIIKYVERILCLKLNNSQKTNPIFHIFNSGDGTLDHFASNFDASVLRGYLLFTVMRPDVNDYLSLNLDFTKIRIETYLKEIAGPNKSLAKNILWELLFEFEYFPNEINTIVGVELGFIFDVVYTKATLIYTKSGCLLRFTSIACSFSVMLIFFIIIMNEPKFYLPRIDTSITCILLGGAITLELYAAWVMLSSDWAFLVATFHHNALVRKAFWVVLNYFPCFFPRSKRWSGYMGQFDLLEYCWRYKKKEANKSCSILREITICSDIIEMWHKHKFPNFVEVPIYLKQSSTYSQLHASLFSENSFKASRGEKALSLARQTDSLKWSIELDFDYSIVIWHLATSVLLFQKDLVHREEKKVSKCMSNYMMYLLTMRTTLLLPEHSKSFWLDQTCDELKKLFVSAPDTRNAAYILLDKEKDTSTSEPTLKKVQGDVHKLVTCLDQVPVSIKWEMIRGVWIEMLLYAALSSEHLNHVKLLGEGIEFLSFLWLFGIHRIAHKCIEKEDE